MDSLKQYKRYFQHNNHTDNKIIRDEYYHINETDDIIYDVVARYCNADNRINDFRIFTLDYYSDLYLYFKISECINLVKTMNENPKIDEYITILKNKK